MRDAWRQALEILDELHHHDAKAVRARLHDVTVTVIAPGAVLRPALDRHA